MKKFFRPWIFAMTLIVTPIASYSGYHLYAGCQCQDCQCQDCDCSKK